MKQFISVIDPGASTSLSCCQISCFGLKRFSSMFLDASRVVYFLHQRNFPRSVESFIDLHPQMLLSSAGGVEKLKSRILFSTFVSE